VEEPGRRLNKGQDYHANAVVGFITSHCGVICIVLWGKLYWPNLLVQNPRLTGVFDLLCI
jgi:hypothetical protein